MSPEQSTTDASPATYNVGLLLAEVAAARPEQVAVAMPTGRDKQGKRQYRSVTFAQLEEDSNRLAAGMAKMGVTPGTRLALMVKPSIEFVSLVFALFKVGAVSILIDPGMGRKNLLGCLDQAKPEGFVAISLAQAVRVLCGRRYREARHNVTVGKRWFWGGPTLEDLRQTDPTGFVPFQAAADDQAAIIFTSGSTGPPKGVEFRHEGFMQQVRQIQEFYRIEPGEIDLPAFPLFGLFNSAMGVTSIIPDMDASRPASVDPRNIIEAMYDWEVTQSFASPAVWNVVGRFCEAEKIQLPTLRRALSAGAPVPPHVLRRLKQAMHPEGDIHTPYGATEALPVASIAASEVLDGTEIQSATGAGTCVGRRFSGIRWKVIAIEDGRIAELAEATVLPSGEIGELIVSGAVVTRRYATSDEATKLAKIVGDSGELWHRMGDVGYLDEQDRFWFCGRKTHRVQTAAGVMFTIPVEAIFNQHPGVFRSALVGIGHVGSQVPVVVVEPHAENYPNTQEEMRKLERELADLAVANEKSAAVQHFLVHPSLPVDVRHNSKIFREKLAVWAEARLGAQLGASLEGS